MPLGFFDLAAAVVTATYVVVLLSVPLQAPIVRLAARRLFGKD